MLRFPTRVGGTLGTGAWGSSTLGRISTILRPGYPNPDETSAVPDGRLPSVPNGMLQRAHRAMLLIVPGLPAYPQ